MEQKLTEKQKRFVDYYIESNGNATEAAKKAGYAKGSYKEAPRWINPRESQYKPYLKSAIDAKLKQMASERTADATEVLEFLTSVLRDQQEDEAIVVEGTGNGMSRARKIKVKVSTRDRIKAGEVLGRIFGMYNDKLQLENAPVPMIVDDMDGDDHE